MAELKLPRLPDRTPIKLTLSLLPVLHAALVDYAKVYEASYGRAERVEDLIPAMLANFLESDREFQRGRDARQR